MHNLKQHLDAIRNEKSFVIHRHGNWYYETNSKIYAMLACIAGNAYLITLEGWYWRDGISVNDYENITEKEWKKISDSGNDENNWIFVCGPQA